MSDATRNERDTPTNPLDDIEADYKARRIIEGKHAVFQLTPTLDNANALVAAVGVWVNRGR